MTALEQRLERVAVTCFRHARPTLLLLAIATTAAFYLMRQVRVSGDLVELLPRSFQSVQDVDRLQEKVGGMGYIAVLAEGAAPDQLRAFACALATELETLDGVDYVDFRRPRQFFEDRAGYYLSLAEVKKMRARIDQRADFEVAKRNRLYDVLGEMDGQEPPSIDFSDIERRYEGAGRGWIGTQTASEYYLDEQNQRILVLAKPRGSSTDLAVAQRIVRQVKTAVGEMDLARFGKPSIAFGGSFTKKVDQQNMVEKDLRLATLVSLILILLYLVFHYRRLLAVALVMVPLMIGLVWTYAIGALAFESLHILTAFIGAILLGLGIDHGIHLLSRFAAEYHTSDSAEEAVRAAFGRTGRAVAVAAATTVVGFGSLGMSEFRAFREFGLLAAAGVALCVAAYACCLPALLGVALRRGWRPSTRTGPGERLFMKLLMAHPSKLLLAFSVVAAALTTCLPRTKFNWDFRALTATSLPSFRMDPIIDDMLGHFQTPVVVLTDSRGGNRAAARALRARHALLGDGSTIDMIANGGDLVPADQHAKYAQFMAIKRRIRKLRTADFTGAEREQFERLQRMVEVPPFDLSDLPSPVRRKFFGRDGTSFVLVYSSTNLSDGENVSRFAEQVRGTYLEDGSAVRVAGASMVMADIFDLVEREAVPVLTATLGLVFLTLLWLLGSLRQSLLALVTALVSIAITLGAAGFLGLSLNYLNIAIVPALFGTGVDGGVHLVSRLEVSPGTARALAESGTAVGGALITTACGFAALLLANHVGLQSLGQLAVLGLVANFAACLLGLAPALLLVRRREHRRDAPS